MFHHSLFVALFVLLSILSVSAATPPACFLACVNEEDKVSDYKAVCASTNMQSCLDEKCSIGALETALTHYQTACKETGYSVTIATPTSGAKQSKSATNNSTNADPSSTASGSAPAAIDDDASGALHSFGVTFMSLYAAAFGVSYMLL